MDKKSSIGVFDTGIGGFSVVKELQHLLPAENIIYFGDSANMPYGNKTRDEILHLTRQILAYMATRDVKAVAVACNTISTLIDEYRDDYPFKIFSVVEAGSYYAATIDATCIGVLGTCFTAQSGVYNRLIAQQHPEVKVVAAGCPNLAHLIDCGQLEPEYIDPELKTAIDEILAQAPVKHLVLACTHFPLVAGRIHELYPELTLIDSGLQQARDIKNWLTWNDLLNDDGEGTFELNTSGDLIGCVMSVVRFGIKAPNSVNRISVATPL